MFVTTLLAMPRARAVPPDERLVLAPDTFKFIKPPFDLIGVAAEPQGFVQVEILPAGEILITAPADAKNGSFGTVIAFGSGKVYAREICVGSCPATTEIASAKAACPSLNATKEDNDPVWVANVKDSKCFAALKQALEHATVPVDSLRLTLEENVANEFIKRVLADLSADPKTKDLKAGYYGATLMLKGETTTPVLGRALLHAYRNTIGRVSYDDSALKLTDRPATENQP